MSAINPLAKWVALHDGLDPEQITNLRVSASPARAWSEVTTEDFSCFVSFDYQGEKRTYYLDEEEACSFLQSLGVS